MNPLQGVISESWAMYRRHAAHLLPIAFVIYLVAAALEAVLIGLLGAFGAFLAFIVSVLSVFVLQATLVKAVEDVRDGRVELSLAETVQAARPRVGTVAGASILAGIAVAIGLLLLIVPGLVLITFLALIVPVIVLEGRGVTEAFRRSTDLVRGHGWAMFGVLVLTMVVYIVVGFIIGVILFALAPWARDFLSTIISGTLLAPFTALALTLSYYRLRDVHPGAAPRPAADDLWGSPQA
jgi:hypothetical protein